MSAAAQPDARAVRLLREVVGCEPDNLPPYNEEEVRLVIEECHEHWGLMQQIFEGLKERRRKEARRRARRKRRAARAAAEAAAAAAAAAAGAAAEEAGPRSSEGDEENEAPAGDENDDDEAAAAAAERRKAQKEAGTSDGGGGTATEAEGGEESDASDEDDGDPFARDPAGAAAVLCHHAIIARNKRLLLTYLSERVERLKALRWRHAVLPPRVRQGLSASEAEFFAAYDRLLSRYSSSSSSTSHFNGAAGLDLTQADRPPRPPGGVMVRCVAASGLGDVAFSTGTFRLDPGSVHTLPPEEAEPLLREGVLVEVTCGAREQQEMPAP